MSTVHVLTRRRPCAMAAWTMHSACGGYSCAIGCRLGCTPAPALARSRKLSSGHAHTGQRAGQPARGVTRAAHNEHYKVARGVEHLSEHNKLRHESCTFNNKHQLAAENGGSLAMAAMAARRRSIECCQATVTGREAAPSARASQLFIGSATGSCAPLIRSPAALGLLRGPHAISACPRCALFHQAVGPLWTDSAGTRRPAGCRKTRIIRTRCTPRLARARDGKCYELQLGQDDRLRPPQSWTACPRAWRSQRLPRDRDFMSDPLAPIQGSASWPSCGRSAPQSGAAAGRDRSSEPATGRQLTWLVLRSPSGSGDLPGAMSPSSARSRSSRLSPCGSLRVQRRVAAGAVSRCFHTQRLRDWKDAGLAGRRRLRGTLPCDRECGRTAGRSDCQSQVSRPKLAI